MSMFNFEREANKLLAIFVIATAAITTAIIAILYLVVSYIRYLLGY